MRVRDCLQFAELPLVGEDDPAKSSAIDLTSDDHLWPSLFDLGKRRSVQAGEHRGQSRQHQSRDTRARRDDDERRISQIRFLP